MKVYVFICKMAILNAIAHNVDAAVEIITAACKHLGARRDNLVNVFDREFPVDDHQNELETDFAL